MKPGGRVGTAETERRMAQFLATARETGLRLTPQRLEIFREVASSLDHPDAEAVHRAVHARMPTVSLDTVYRTLWTLSDLGLVSTLGARRDRVRFDANPRNHHHWVCVRCGMTRDFDAAGLHGLRLPHTLKGFGRVLSTHVEARGVCRDCAGKRDGPEPSSTSRPNGRKGHNHV
ncbi:MAG: transcriptional repressor [Candidatus Brocadiae bacterium]|nr:transcriptional repressor [Candidatus Brocadiia bacterium]